MSVTTAYDEKRDELRRRLDECVNLAREMALGTDIWGYDEMREDYAMEVFNAVKKARDAV